MDMCRVWGMGKVAWLVAGGTGGHMFPAQAVAEELLARGWRVHLLTDARGRRFWPDSLPAQVTELPAGSIFAGGPGARLRAACNILRGLRLTARLMRQTRPDVVMGFGGYPVFAAGLSAWRRGVPLILHEQNAVLGRANRVLARIATQIALSFAETRRLPEGTHAKTVVTGNPVRAAFQPCAGAPYIAPELNQPLHLLVLGGSLGARVFGVVLPEALALLPNDLHQRLCITQQCRAEDLAHVTTAYQQLGITHHVAPFLEDVPAQMAAAQLVIARSGASTIAELEAVGRPALLVPYPHAMDDHQTANAAALAARGAAWVVPERELTAAGLAERLQTLLMSPDLLAAAAQAADNSLWQEAASLLASLAIKTIEGHLYLILPSGLKFARNAHSPPCDREEA
jgi:UDP-N-acetylglucosamine--N-acetylmuramyl-(pentapeptide) pyrophosphoryl-undecaprenol N-acetylglucosamine transferase